MQVLSLFESLRNLFRHPITAGTLGALLVAASLFGFRAVGGFEALELTIYDRMVVLRSQGVSVDPHVVQVVVGEADLDKYGWPLSDEILAQVVDRLRDDGARAIGIDIFRPTPVGPGTDHLAQTIAATPQLVWVDRFPDGTDQGIAAPQPAVDSKRVGFGDLVLDGGGMARRGLLYLNDGDLFEASMPLKLALLFLASEGIRPASDADQSLRLGHISLTPLDADLGGYANIDDRGYQIMREFRAPVAILQFPLQDLLSGAVPAAAIAGRVVVVGVVTDTVKDFVITPLDRDSARGTPGSTLHGMFAAQLIHHALDGLPTTRPLTKSQEARLLVLVLVMGAAVGLFARQALRMATLSLLGAGLLLGGSYVAFLHAIWLPTGALVTAWIGACVVTAVAAAFAERAQRAILMRLFSIYASAPIAKDVWRRRNEFTTGGRPIPLRLTATVLASDINDFTTVSEVRDPEIVARWINLYMEEMTRLVDEFGGMVENFAGDGLMAVWGAPIARKTPAEIEADGVAAVRCALGMATALNRLNARYRQEGLPEMRIGVGLYSGELIGCSLGSSQRQQYSTIGDTTNTAARLVSVAKDRMKSGQSEDACQVVIGETTLALLGDKFVTSALGSFPLKGKSQAVACYLVEGEAAPARIVASARSP